MQVAGGRRDEPEPDQHDGARRDAKLGTPVSPLPLVTPPGPGCSRSCSRLASQAIFISSKYYFT
jgi:hypothetical protein